jgi:adiponectin receptor
MGFFQTCITRPVSLVLANGKPCAFTLAPHPVNINTHLGGAIVFSMLLSSSQATYMTARESATWLDAVMLPIFLSSAIICLLCSACFHALMCHSKEVDQIQSIFPSHALKNPLQVRNQSATLDHIGIVGEPESWSIVHTILISKATFPVLIVGSFYPTIYYAFICETGFQCLYLSIITIAGVCQSFPDPAHQRESFDFRSFP